VTPAVEFDSTLQFVELHGYKLYVQTFGDSSHLPLVAALRQQLHRGSQMHVAATPTPTPSGVKPMNRQCSTFAAAAAVTATGQPPAISIKRRAHSKEWAQ
jgi:hypothetical protein